jgi:hypothetical protein
MTVKEAKDYYGQYRPEPKNLYILERQGFVETGRIQTMIVRAVDAFEARGIAVRNDNFRGWLWSQNEHDVSIGGDAGSTIKKFLKDVEGPSELIHKTYNYAERLR